MKTRHLLLLVFFSFLFLFYPGDGYYIRLFSFNRQLFARQEEKINYLMQAVPYVVDPSVSPVLSAEGVYVVDLASFTPLLEKNSRRRFLPASTTKIITALVVSDSYAADTVLTVKRVIDEGQTMELVKGEQMTLENLLYGLLVHSANDAAYVLADNYPTGYDGFITAMNQKAQQLGMRDSSFANPAGLDDRRQQTSPYDLALAGRKLLTNPELKKIVSIKNITVSDVDFTRFHRLANINKLLGEVPGIGGLKTGYTEEAGENLVTLYKKNGHQFLIVILKSQDRFEDTKQLIAWLENNVRYLDF